MKIQGISHITLICKNLEKTTLMLQKIFNAKEVYASGDKTFSIAKEKFFTIGCLWVAIMEGHSLKKTYNHIAFQVTKKDLPLFARKIKTIGLQILPSRSRKKAEGNSIYFYDYDNHLFELHAGTLKNRLKFYRAN